MLDTTSRLLPLGTSDFAALRARDQIYVDKTDLIAQLALRPEKFFLSRPRRFGKSLLVSTFEALFKYGLKDFKGLAIEHLWTEKRTYSVVRLDFSEIKNFLSLDAFRANLNELLVRSFGRCGFILQEKSFFSVKAQISEWLISLPTNSLVLLIDEYDAPLTACLNNKELFDSVRNELAEFYAIIKSNDAAIRFFFMTGITKFNKASIFSELNNFSDLTLDPAFGSLLGYTRKEVEHYFGDYLIGAAKILGLNNDELLDELAFHYDGFCFEETAQQKVFAPWSVLKFFSSPERGFKDYWFESGGRPSALLQYLRTHTLKNPEEYGKEKTIALSRLIGSSDTESLSDIGLLTQTGYLTIKAVEYGAVFVDYPNSEVRTAMAQLYLEQVLGGRIAGEVGAGPIVKVLSKESAESVFHILNKVFKAIDYHNYPVKDEVLVRAIVQVYMAGAGLRPRVEVHNHRGRSDLEVKAGNKHWVMEFKVARKGQNADSLLKEAVDQIRSQNYGDSHRSEELRRLALVFSVEKREFVRWEEIANV